MALRRLEQLSARRHGVFTRELARSVGVSDATLDRMRARGAVVRVHPSVYSFASVPRTDRWAWLAAVDSAAPLGYLSGDAALQLMGVRKHCWRGRAIEVVSTRRHRPRPGVRYVCTTALPDDERTSVDGIAVLRLERVLVERAAAGETEAVLCSLMDEGAYQRRFSTARMRRVLRRHARRPGHRRLLRAFDRYLHGEGGADSTLEDRLGARIEAEVIGRIERNRMQVIGGRRMRPDMLLPDIRIAIEIDGMHGHARPTRRRDDEQRNLAYRRGGYTPLRIRDTHEGADLQFAIEEIRRRQADVTWASHGDDHVTSDRAASVEV